MEQKSSRLKGRFARRPNGCALACKLEDSGFDSRPFNQIYRLGFFK